MVDFYNYKEEKNGLIAEPAELLERSRRELHSLLSTFQFSSLGWLGSALTGITLGLAFYLSPKDMSNVAWSSLIPHLGLGALFGVVVYAYLFSVLRVICLKKLRRVELHIANRVEGMYPHSEAMADQVFKLALSISVSGFIVVVAGIVMILYRETEQAYMITSAGIISQCIAALVLSVYSKLISKVVIYRPKTFYFEFD
jgi:hypothetical protein